MNRMQPPATSLHETQQKQQLLRIYLIARAAETIFDDEGEDSIRHLRDHEKEYLASGLESVQAAIRWLTVQLEELLSPKNHN